MIMFPQRHKKNPPVFDKAKYNEYKSLGGWMLINLMTKVIALVWNTVSLLGTVEALIKISGYTQTREIRDAYNNALFITVGIIISILLQLACAAMIFIKKPYAVYWIRTINIVALIIFMVTQSLYNVAFGTDASSIRYADIAWLVYYFKSERVKYYFGLIKRPRTFRPVQNIEAPIRTE